MWKKFFTERFADFNTSDEIADWLSRMLCLLYTSPCLKEVQEFRFLNSEQEGPAFTMDFLYRECIPTEKKLMFRQAISNLLLRHEKDAKVPAETFEDLIYLVGRMKEVDLLDALASAVGNRLARKGEKKSLYLALAVLGFFAPATEVRKAVSSLMDSDGFDERYLFSALKILVECEPAPMQLDAIIKRFKSRIVNRYYRIRDGSIREMNEFWRAFEDIFSGNSDREIRERILVILK